MKKSMFTLLELLAVIAIVGILFSFAFSALAGANSRAKKANCQSNLRSIGQAIAEYGEDHDGYALPASFGTTTHGELNHWINYLYHVEGVSKRAFRCPSSAKPFDPDGHSPVYGNTLTKASYIMNIVAPGKWSGADITNKGKSTGWGVNSVTPIRFNDVMNPVSAIHVLDAVEGIFNTHSGVNTFKRTDHGKRAYPPTGQTRWVGDHHSEGFNVLFGDGHVKFQQMTKHDEWKVTEQK